MKKLMMAAIVLFSVVACNEKNDDSKTQAELLIGMWYPTTTIEVIKDETGKELVTEGLFSEHMTLEFLEGGAVVNTLSNLESKGTWKLEGNSIVVKFTDVEYDVLFSVIVSEHHMSMVTVAKEGTLTVAFARTSAADMKSQPLVGEWKIMTAQQVGEDGNLTDEPMDLSGANIIAMFLKNGYFGDSFGAIGTGTWAIDAGKLKVMIPAVDEKPAVEMLAPFSIDNVDEVETLTARLNVAMIGGALMEAQLVRVVAPGIPE